MRTRKLLHATLLTLLIARPGGLAAGIETEAPLAAQRDQFVTAEQALAAGDMPRYEALKATLLDYPLLPYLEAAELRRDLDTAPAATVQAFLTRYADTPLATPLRLAWLTALARREAWAELRDAYRPGLGSTAQCLYARAQLATGDTAAAYAAARTLWLTGQSQPDACTALFDAWRDAGALTPALIWQRFGLAMDAGAPGLGRHLQTQLPAPQRARADAWMTLATDPLRADVQPLLVALGADAPRAWSAALARYARTDPAGVARVWEDRREALPFTTAQRLQVDQALAVMLAVARDPAAQRYFARVPPQARDAALRAWQVRLALRARNWPAVLTALHELTAEEAASSRWQYWRARALEALGRPGAEAAYATAARERDLYGFLAAAHLGQPIALKHAPLPVDAQAQATLAALPGLQRAQQLHALARITPAQAEIAMALAGRSTAEIAQSAALLHRWGWHAQAIALAAQAGAWDDLDLRFPAPYGDAVQAGASAQDLPEALVRAVIRRESAYEPQARSSADARGLMQLLPATAQRVARSLGEPWNPANLGDPRTNVRYGSFYFARVLRDFAGHVALAAASYNAGPNRVRRWLPLTAPMPADLWIETIPFGETREYVAAVTAYAVIYQARGGGAPLSITQLLPPVPTADTVAMASATRCAGRDGDPDC